MVALVERGLQRFNLVAVQLGNEMCQMVQLVQVFILGEIVIQAHHIAVKGGDEKLLIPHAVHADIF